MTAQITPPKVGSTTAAAHPDRVLAFTTGIAAIAMAIYQVSTEGPPEGATYESISDYVREGLLLLYLVATVGAIFAARHRGLAPRWSARLVSGGYALVATGVAIGLAVREELDWFFALAGPGLLASIVGFVVWAVWARRHDVLPLGVAVLLAVGGPLSIVLAEVGTTVLIGGFWLYLGTRFNDGGRARRV